MMINMFGPPASPFPVPTTNSAQHVGTQKLEHNPRMLEPKVRQLLPIQPGHETVPPMWPKTPRCASFHRNKRIRLCRGQMGTTGNLKEWAAPGAEGECPSSGIEGTVFSIHTQPAKMLQGEHQPLFFQGPSRRKTQGHPSQFH